jgi:hypothetical protein
LMGLPKFGVVEDVEKIRSRLKSKPLVELELPAQRQIDLGSAESAQGISSQLSLHRTGGIRPPFETDSEFSRGAALLSSRIDSP